VIFPSITETLVLPIDAFDVEQRISDGIENKKFIGVIKRGRFSLSAHLIRPPQFQPMVRGRIESSSRGSLVFLRYELMPATKILLGFVSILLLGFTIGAAIERSAPFYPLSAIAMVFIFRAVAFTNIKIHRTPVRQNLLDILS
jgi:hypothetical protein